MLAPRFVAEILVWLLAQSDHGDTYRHFFLAARCVGEVRKRAELGDVEQRTLDCAKELMRFDLRYYYKFWDDEARTVRAIRTHQSAW